MSLCYTPPNNRFAFFALKHLLRPGIQFLSALTWNSNNKKPTCAHNISTMKIKTFLAILFLSIASLASYGWGATGHRAVGLIAERYLSAAAKKKLQKILKGESVAIVGTWMDEIRSDSTYDYTADWHWVTIETGKTYDESPKNPKGDIILTIERLIKELKSKDLSAKQEAESVKMLIHLIGDLHQPLHVGCCDDLGGNRARVKWFNDNSNLHRVWDSDMIDHTKLSYTELANAAGKPSKEILLKLQKGSVRDWASESMRMRKQVYAIGDGNLGYKYSYRNLDSVKQRILEAGIRLAWVLNGIYK
jgi:S1/P1 Nuclease